MKIQLLSLLLFYGTTLFSQSIPMVSECNIWYERGQFGGWGPYPEQHMHHTYFFNGDTIVDGLEYKKLFWDRRDTTFNSSTSVTQSLTLHRLMRQDGDVVYERHLNASEEKFYTDFNISLGDTLKYQPLLDNPWDTDDNLTILAIDSVLTGGNYLRSYELSNGNFFFESVGASFGLFNDFSLGIEGGIYLNCFIQNENYVELGYLAGVYPCNPTIYGCLDNTACNYSESATEDSGHCVYAPCFTTADLNSDGTISTQDILMFLGNLGCQGTECNGDVDRNGIVNMEDLLFILTLINSIN